MRTGKRWWKKPKASSLEGCVYVFIASLLAFHPPVGSFKGQELCSGGDAKDNSLEIVVSSSNLADKGKGYEGGWVRAYLIVYRS